MGDTRCEDCPCRYGECPGGDRADVLAHDLADSKDVIADRDRQVARLTARVRELGWILGGEQAIRGAFGRTRLWGALCTVIGTQATEDELDQIMRLLNDNSKSIDAALTAKGGE